MAKIIVLNAPELSQWRIGDLCKGILDAAKRSEDFLQEKPESWQLYLFPKPINSEVLEGGKIIIQVDDLPRKMMSDGPCRLVARALAEETAAKFPKQGANCRATNSNFSGWFEVPPK